MDNELKIFTSEEFGQIRTVVIDDEMWFVGKDIAKVLGYERATKAVADHVNDDDKDEVPIQDSIGRKQNTPIINESGMYSLILSSKLPSAQRFKHWVTSDVLPTIRKTGGYVADDELFVNTYLPFADDATKFLFKTSLSTIRSQNQLIQKQQIEIAEQQNVIEHKQDVIVGLVNDISIADQRQILNRVVRHKNADYHDRWSLLYREFENKFHINLSHRFEKYNETCKPKCKSKIDYIDRVLNKIPELYELVAKLFENDVKELVKEMYRLTT